jgi:hypothetical protein
MNFNWEALAGDGTSYAASYDRQKLVLTNVRCSSFFEEDLHSLLQLTAGRLNFRVTVRNATHEGQTTQAVVVLAEKKPNKPPRAVIRPDSPVHGIAGSQVVLDAEGR